MELLEFGFKLSITFMIRVRLQEMLQISYQKPSSYLYNQQLRGNKNGTLSFSYHQGTIVVLARYM
jgi:hypothetical protein